jgi:predicted chitinase
MALHVQGIDLPEQVCAELCRTHTGGTDHISQIAAVLNDKLMHAAEYIVVDLHIDPPTDAQVDELFRHVKLSVDNGFAVIGNFISPANNPPRPIAVGHEPAAQRPNFYNSGTIYHYVSFGGWADENGTDAVWVIDSGGAPFGYWLTARQAAVLCAGKGYAYARPKGVALPGPAAALDDAEALSIAWGGSLPIDRYRELVPHVREALRLAQCDNPRRVAQWFAQTGHESAGGLYSREIDPGHYLEGRADLGNHQPGDGPRYRGSGWLQITGRENHRAVSEWAFRQGIVPDSEYFLNFPEELSSDRYAGAAVAWYWTVARPNINPMSDVEDHEGVCRAINGGLNGFDDRVQRYHKAMTVADLFVPGVEVAPVPLPPPAPEPVPTLMPTPLTGRPHHHSQAEDLEGLLLNVRAEGLLTQAMVFAIAESVGVDARAVYERARESF